MATTNNNRTLTNVDKLIRDLSALRAENTKLKAMLSKQNRYSSIVYRATVDAHTILLAAFSGESTSKGAMQTEGLSVRRWEWGVAFLRYAGIVAMQNNDWRTGLTFTVTLLDEAVKLLERSARELDNPAGYKRLRALVKRKRRFW
jgi:hypothetical protein